MRYWTTLIISLLIQAVCVLVNVVGYVSGGHHWWSVAGAVFCGVLLLLTAWLGFWAVATDLVGN